MSLQDTASGRNFLRRNCMKFYLLERKVAATAYTNQRNDYRQPTPADILQAVAYAEKLYGPMEEVEARQ